MKLKLSERRRYIRVEVPLKVIITGTGGEEKTFIKNISPTGVRFENRHKFGESEIISLSVYLPSSDKPINIKGKVRWQEETSIEDNAPYDVGVEIIEVGENSKVVLLKYLCDLLYGASYKSR